MEFVQLEIVLKLAENQNIEKTAEDLGRSSSSIRSQLKSLETELDCELFSRQGNIFTLTDSGRIVSASAEKILRLTAELPNQIHDYEYLNSSVTCLYEEVTGLILPIIHQFQAEHPRIKLKMLHLPKGNNRETLIYDTMVFLSRQAIYDANTVLLQTGDCVLTMSPEHPLAHHTALNLIDVREESFILSSIGSEPRRIEDAYFPKLVSTLLSFLKQTTRLCVRSWLLQIWEWLSISLRAFPRTLQPNSLPFPYPGRNALTMYT